MSIRCPLKTFLEKRENLQSNMHNSEPAFSSICRIICAYISQIQTPVIKLRQSMKWNSVSVDRHWHDRFVMLNWYHPSKEPKHPNKEKEDAMKKILVLQLAAGMVLSMCACGTGWNNTVQSPSPFGGKRREQAVILTPSTVLRCKLAIGWRAEPS